MAMLPEILLISYESMKPLIQKRLQDFTSINEKNYFYELCYCLCTPQSKAANANKVQQKLASSDFLNTKFDPTQLLRDKDHYIRFHNQKAKRLLAAADSFNDVKEILDSNLGTADKRIIISQLVNGLGMKESSHFMRNIGYSGLAILDRHILKNLVLCGLYDAVPKVSSVKQYIGVENEFQHFAEAVGISIDELDLLFWSYETGEILK